MDKMESKFRFITKQISNDRIKGLKTLRSFISSLVPLTTHNTESDNNNVHTTIALTSSQLLFDFLKEKKKEDEVIVVVLDCVQGLCLQSFLVKQWWGHVRLCVVLTLLASRNDQVLMVALETIESILIDSCCNSRAFEVNGGIDLVCALLKKKKSENIMFKLVELLGVYLLDERFYPDFAEYGVDYAIKDQKVELQLGIQVVQEIKQQIKM
jgi:hypothetical protein